MKKRNNSLGKKRILFCIIYTLIYAFGAVLMFHYTKQKGGNPPLSWVEIWDERWLIGIGSLIIGAFTTFILIPYKKEDEQKTTKNQ